MVNENITVLLQAYTDGNKGVVDQLLPLLYDELRKLAGFHMQKERDGHTLTPTSLVHEAYMKLINQDQVNWQNRSHFMAVASTAMRRILINYAKQKLAQKRGGDAPMVTFNEEIMSGDTKPEELIMLDRALEKLQSLSERQSKVVEYKFFGGLTFEEIAEVIKVAVPTVRRDWRLARAWLTRELKD